MFMQRNFMKKKVILDRLDFAVWHRSDPLGHIERMAKSAWALGQVSSGTEGTGGLETALFGVKVRYVSRMCKSRCEKAHSESKGLNLISGFGFLGVFFTPIGRFTAFG